MAGAVPRAHSFGDAAGEVATDLFVMRVTMSDIVQPYVLWRVFIAALLIAGRWFAERCIPRNRGSGRRR